MTTLRFPAVWAAVYAAVTVDCGVCGTEKFLCTNAIWAWAQSGNSPLKATTKAHATRAYDRSAKTCPPGRERSSAAHPPASKRVGHPETANSAQSTACASQV